MGFYLIKQFCIESVFVSLLSPCIDFFFFALSWMSLPDEWPLFPSQWRTNTWTTDQNNNRNDLHFQKEGENWSQVSDTVLSLRRQCCGMWPIYRGPAGTCRAAVGSVCVHDPHSSIFKNVLSFWSTWWRPPLVCTVLLVPYFLHFMMSVLWFCAVVFLKPWKHFCFCSSLTVRSLWCFVKPGFCGGIKPCKWPKEKKNPTTTADLY